MIKSSLIDLFLIVEKFFNHGKKVEQTDNFISVWEEEKSMWNVTSPLYKNFLYFL